MATKKQDEPSTEIDIIDSEGNVVVPLADTGLGDYLSREARDTQIPEGGAYRDIVQQILTADTAMAVLTPPEVLSAPQVVDRPFLLHAARIQDSDIPDSTGFYVSLDVELIDTQERVVVNTGHQAMMAQIIKLVEFNEFPYLVEIYKAGKSNQYGTIPLRLRAVTEAGLKERGLT
jgi:hypothetical protein